MTKPDILKWNIENDTLFITPLVDLDFSCRYALKTLFDTSVFTNVIINCVNIVTIDSSIIGLLVFELKTKKEISLLCKKNQHIAHVLELVGLTKHIKLIYEDYRK